jgi:hypothetical protein
LEFCTCFDGVARFLDESLSDGALRFELVTAALVSVGLSIWAWFCLAPLRVVAGMMSDVVDQDRDGTI